MSPSLHSASFHPTAYTRTHSPSNSLARGLFHTVAVGWVGKAFPNELVASFALCRRPSSWLAPSSRVLAVVVKGLAEKSRAPEQPEKQLPDSPQSHR